MAYSERLLDYFWRPKNHRVMRDADAVGVAGVPGRGPFMVVYLRLTGGVIEEAAYQTHGCPPSIAAGTLLATVLPGTPALEAPIRWTEAAINEALGGLPDHKRHCSVLAAAALERAVAAQDDGQKASSAPGRSPS